MKRVYTKPTLVKSTVNLQTVTAVGTFSGGKPPVDVD